MTERLFVVATERHVERLASGGWRGVTRQWLFERLASSLLLDVMLATPLESRIALAESMRDEGAGSLDAIELALASLRESCVDVEALDSVASGSGPAAERARRLATAMRALDGRLERAGLVDARRSKELLASRISRLDGGVVAKAVGARELSARWIVGWTPAEARLWRALDAALSRVGGRARVELASFERRLDAERERDPLEIVWDELAQHLEDPPDQRAIEPVLGDLTLTTPLPSSSLARIELRTATDARAEAKAAADAIASALTRGVPIDRIAVGVLDSNDETVRALGSVLRDAGIPVHHGRATPSSSLLATAKDALELASRGLERTRVAALLRSDYLDAARLTSLTEPGRRPRALLHELAAALEATPTEAAEDPVARLAATALSSFGARAERGTLARAVGELLSSVEVTASRASHVALTRGLLDRLGLRPRADAALKRACASSAPMSPLDAMDVGAHFDDLTAWQALVNALDDVARAAVHVGAAAPIAAASFRHELWRAVDARLHRSVGARAGAVRLVGLAELAEEELALLVICAATAEAIPGFASSSQLVTVALSNALRARDPLAAPASQALASARSLASIAWAASRADRVVLCRATHDDSGTAVAAAPLVQWLRRAGVPAVTFGAGVIADRPWTPRDRALAVIALAPEHADAMAPDAVRRAHVEGDREAFHQGADELDWAVVGKLSNDPVSRAVLEAETGGGARPLGTTALERFAACAFQGFAQSVLGGREELFAEDTPSRLEEGTLAHEMLRVAFEATRAAWRERPRDRDAIMTTALAAVDALAGDRARGLRRAAIRRIRDEVRDVLSASIDDLDWDFDAAEREFGEEASWAVLSLAGGQTKLSLTGKIDRVDVSRDGSAIRVIDYKRRSKPYATPELGETLLQLPIYAKVAARELGRRDAFGKYVLTQAPASTAPNWEARWAGLGVTSNDSALDEHLLEIVRSVRQGVVLPKPRHDKSCRACGSDGVCRRPRFTIPRED